MNGVLHGPDTYKKSDVAIVFDDISESLELIAFLRINIVAVLASSHRLQLLHNCLKHISIFFKFINSFNFYVS